MTTRGRPDFPAEMTIFTTLQRATWWCGGFSFLPQSKKNVIFELTVYFKLAMGVDVRLNGDLSLCASLAAKCNLASCLMTAGTGSSVTLNWISRGKYMDKKNNLFWCL